MWGEIQGASYNMICSALRGESSMYLFFGISVLSPIGCDFCPPTDDNRNTTTKNDGNNLHDMTIELVDPLDPQ